VCAHFVHQRTIFGKSDSFEMDSPAIFQPASAYLAVKIPYFQQLRRFFPDQSLGRGTAPRKDGMQKSLCQTHDPCPMLSIKLNRASALPFRDTGRRASDTQRAAR
jgi:hypothetical protein